MPTRHVIIYAGSLRPGGGLTVAKIVIEALAHNVNNSIVVYTGSKDCSEYLTDIFNSYNNVHEVHFFQKTNAHTRYLISKIFFLFSVISTRVAITTSKEKMVAISSS